MTAAGDLPSSLAPETPGASPCRARSREGPAGSVRLGGSFELRRQLRSARADTVTAAPGAEGRGLPGPATLPGEKTGGGRPPVSAIVEFPRPAVSRGSAAGAGSRRGTGNGNPGTTDWPRTRSCALHWCVHADAGGATSVAFAENAAHPTAARDVPHRDAAAVVDGGPPPSCFAAGQCSRNCRTRVAACGCCRVRRACSRCRSRVDARRTTVVSLSETTSPTRAEVRVVEEERRRPTYA
jgi:hypothetical protein